MSQPASLLLSTWLHDLESDDRSFHTTRRARGTLRRFRPSYDEHGQRLPLDYLLPIALAGYGYMRQHPQLRIAGTVKPYRAVIAQSTDVGMRREWYWLVLNEAPPRSM
jgi:hypothetical protein